MIISMHSSLLYIFFVAVNVNMHYNITNEVFYLNAIRK